ncbi:MAG: hypothetical protein HY747_00805 [Elusimicrobia bacterium]|nr:hypothetical protein [Elusimicrobiota bacterium]
MKKIKPFIQIPDGRQIEISQAQPQDAPAILGLYHHVYGGNYPFALASNIDDCVKAVKNDNYLWLLMRHEGRPVGSVVFHVDKNIALAKVFGAVVAQEYRGFDLTEQTISLGIEHLVIERRLVKSVYATIRTVSLAPQRLVEKLGFKKLGVFPNVHRVHASETHTLAVYFSEETLRGRRITPHLPSVLKPFFQIVRRESGIGEAQYTDIALELEPATRTPASFEAIQAPQFILKRFRETKSRDALDLDFFPFHDPNLLLVSADGATELYCYRSTRDGHCVIIGAKTGRLRLRTFLDHAARFLENIGTRYVELLIKTDKAEAITEALGAGFLPSAYYPAMRWDAAQNRTKDYLVLSRSFVMLDFKGIHLQPAYVDYLMEYIKLWRRLHLAHLLPPKHG